MKIISVVPLKKGILKRDLTYFTSLDIPVGNIVSVPLRGKKTLALVTESSDLKESKSGVKEMNFNLQKASEDKGPSIFRKEFLDAVFDTSTYFAQNKNTAMMSLIPNIFIEKYDKIAIIINPAPTPPEFRVGFSEINLRAEKLLFQYPFAERISIYKTLVRESFARGTSVFLVLPTQTDIDTFSGELSKGIEQFTFSLHSGLSAKKNLLTYEKVVTTSHPVLIIGTPPFLSIPRHDISTIILEDEASGSYRMLRCSHFDLRTFVEIYASKINAKLVFASEMLRFETIARQNMDGIHVLHPLSFRVDFGGNVEVLAKAAEGKGKKFQIFRDQAIEEIRATLQNNKSVFIFTLRKGLATMTICKDCNEIASCNACGSPLVLYLSHQGKKRMFVCNRCQIHSDGDALCSLCGSWNLMPLGIGTDTVAEEAKKLFPKAKIFQLDKESAKTAAGAKKIIKEFEENNGSILIGTEMAFFYLREKVPLSVIASFDSLWSIPNFRMSEKIIQILLSMVSRTRDKFIIQTKNENDGAVKAINSGNAVSFVREEIEDRRNLSYPPFMRFIKITHLGDKEQTVRARKLLEEIFAEYSPEIFSGFVARLKGKYAINALIKIDPQKWSLPEISLNSRIDENLLAKLTSLPSTFEVFVDPEDLL